MSTCCAQRFKPLDRAERAVEAVAHHRRRVGASREFLKYWPLRVAATGLVGGYVIPYDPEPPRIEDPLAFRVNFWKVSIGIAALIGIGGLAKLGYHSAAGSFHENRLRNEVWAKPELTTEAEQSIYHMDFPEKVQLLEDLKLWADPEHCARLAATMVITSITCCSTTFIPLMDGKQGMRLLKRAVWNR